MEKLLERVEQMEAQISVLKDEKFGNKSKMKVLETRLCRSEKRIEELEERPCEGDGCCISRKEVKELMQSVLDLDRRQRRLQKQHEDASTRFERVDKLQLLLNRNILKKHQTDQTDPLDDVMSELDSLRDKLEDLTAETENMSYKIDGLGIKWDLMNIFQETKTQSRLAPSTAPSDFQVPPVLCPPQTGPFHTTNIPHFIDSQLPPWAFGMKPPQVVGAMPCNMTPLIPAPQMTSSTVNFIDITPANSLMPRVPMPARMPQFSMGTTGTTCPATANARQRNTVQTESAMARTPQATFVSMDEDGKSEEAPGQAPLNPAMLAAVPLEEQKQMLGERLFPLIREMIPDRVGKITGMLLELDNSEVLHFLESPEALKLKVDEAVAVYEFHQNKKKAVVTIKEQDSSTD